MINHLGSEFDIGEIEALGGKPGPDSTVDIRDSLQPVTDDVRHVEALRLGRAVLPCTQASPDGVVDRPELRFSFPMPEVRACGIDSVQR